MSREAMQLALEALESDPISHAGLVSRKQAITALRQARSLTDELMDCVDRLGSEADTVDPRVWQHLLVYAPKPEEEPVAWLKTWSDGSLTVLKTKSHAFADHELEPLYTAPPNKEWVGLKDEEKIELWNKHENHWRFEDNLMAFTRAIEQALKEKNHG